MVFSSLTNADPGDIFQTIKMLKNCKISVSVICLSASIFILNKIARETLGKCNLAKDRDHFEDLLKRFLVPTALPESVSDSKTANKISISFPKFVLQLTP